MIALHVNHLSPDTREPWVLYSPLRPNAIIGKKEFFSLSLFFSKNTDMICITEVPSQQAVISSLVVC